jgi:hypothetical protein
MAIDDRHGRPAVVDEQLVAGQMDLAQAALLTVALLPVTLVVAELGRVLEAPGLDDLLHWNPRCRHRVLLQSKRRGYAG